MIKNKLLLIFSFIFIGITLGKAQATFSQITALFQANCTIGCHNASDNSGNMNLTGTDTEIYNRLVNVSPTNPAAQAAGYMRIKPGHPDQSYLVRKCNNELYQSATLPDESFGTPMPNYPQPALANEQIELIRQWVYEGAPLTGSPVNVSLINTYYQEGGINSIPEPPPLPTEQGSFQLHIGKIFLTPQTEKEYFIKYDLGLTENIYVNRIELIMADQSHHFILYKFIQGQDDLFEDGLRLQNPSTGEGSSGNSSTLVNAWQISYDTELPEGTAYLWEAGDILDMNYHFRNYDLDSILAIEAYINIYTDQSPEPPEIMYSDLITNLNIFIPNDNNPRVFTKADFDLSADNFINIWQLTSHTHKYGTDFDIFKRNEDGSEGEKIYEGWYNTNYTFNQGYYDFSHPPIRQFEPLIEVNPRWGLIQQATYRNNGPNPVFFGLTTNDEMMVYYLQYTLGGLIDNPAAISDNENSTGINIYPNPSSNYFNIELEYQGTENLNLEIHDLSGKLIRSESLNMLNGQQVIHFPHQLKAGFYIIDLFNESYSFRKKIAIN
ncbi:MAG: T9SS type A sorting domain-containing protein [Bacteroidia bacterium]